MQSHGASAAEVRSSSPIAASVRQQDNDTQASARGQMHHGGQRDTSSAHSAIAPAVIDAAAAATDVSVIAEGFSSGTNQQSSHIYPGSDHTSIEDAGDLDLEETIIHHGEYEHE